MSCGSFLHVNKSSLALFNLLAYASCYFILKKKKYRTLIKVQQLNENSPNHRKSKKKSRKTWIILFASSDFAHYRNFECTSTSVTFPKNSLLQYLYETMFVELSQNRTITSIYPFLIVLLYDLLNELKKHGTSLRT